LVTWSGHR